MGRRDLCPYDKGFMSVLFVKKFLSETGSPNKLSHVFASHKLKMNSPKSTRVHLSIAKKIEILDFVKKTKLKKEVCLRYNLAPSTLGIIKT